MSTKKDDDSKPRCVIENDKVPTDWMDGQEGHTVKEWGQREYLSGYKAGMEAGRLTASTHIITYATNLFRAGKDEEAIRMRNLAAEVLALKL